MKFIPFILIAFPIFSNGQTNPEILNVCGNKVGDDICGNAPTNSLCDLDGLTFNTEGFTVDNDPIEQFTVSFCKPGSTTHNDVWFGFTAQQHVVHLYFDNHGCTSSNNSCRGIQAGIFETDCKVGASYCNTLTCVNCVASSFDLIYNNLVPGQFYYIMVDGCCGDICDYTLNVIEGLADPTFDVTIPQNELCYDDLSHFNTTTLYAATYPINDNYIYEWTTDDGIIIGDNTKPSVEVGKVGTYKVAVRETINCCKAESNASITLSTTAPSASATVSGTLSTTNPSVTLTGSYTYGTEGEYVYAWQNPDGTNLPNGYKQLTVSVTSPGDYIFSVYEKNTSCTDTAKVTVIETTDISNFELESKINLTPNPVKDWISFDAPKNISSIEIFNMMGESIEIISVNNNEIKYTTNELSNGVYFAKIRINDTNYVKKFEVLK